jgi:hypothetical protein
MRDALERFAVSITQARILLTPEAARDIVNRILNPVAPTPPQPAGTAAANATIASAGQAEDPYVPGFAQPGAVPVARMQSRSRKGVTRKQWTFLIIMFVIWCLIMAAFIFLVAKDLFF